MDNWGYSYTNGICEELDKVATDSQNSNDNPIDGTHKEDSSINENLMFNKDQVKVEWLYMQQLNRTLE